MFLRRLLKRIIRKIRGSVFMPSRIIRSTARESLEAECHALEQVFTVLTAGTFVGIPALPLPITFELLPYMEEDLISLLNMVDTTAQPLSHLFSVFNVT